MLQTWITDVQVHDKQLLSYIQRVSLGLISMKTLKTLQLNNS